MYIDVFSFRVVEETGVNVENYQPTTSKLAMFIKMVYTSKIRILAVRDIVFAL